MKENQMAYDPIFGMNLSPQVHSSQHSGWHPITWLKGHDYWPLDGYMHLSVSPLACGAHEHDRHCKTLWSVTHNWRHGASSARVPTFCAFFPTQDGVTCDQFGIPGGTLKLIASSQKRIYNVPNWQPPPKSVDHLYTHRREPRWNDCFWPFGSTVCFLGLSSDSSELHASVDVADQ